MHLKHNIYIYVCVCQDSKLLAIAFGSHTPCPRAKCFSNLVLTERNMQVEFDLKLSVSSFVVDI